MGVEGVSRELINSALFDLQHYLQIFDKDIEATFFEVIGKK